MLSGNETFTVEGEAFTLRPARLEDMGYVYPTWMAQAREHRPRAVKSDVFNGFFPDVVKRLIEAEDVGVIETGGTLHGWACGRGPNVLHYAFVHHRLRGYGLGRAIVTYVLGTYPKVVWVTSSPLSYPHHLRYVYNPYLLGAA